MEGVHEPDLLTWREAGEYVRVDKGPILVQAKVERCHRRLHHGPLLREATLGDEDDVIERPLLPKKLDVAALGRGVVRAPEEALSSCFELAEDLFRLVPETDRLLGVP